MLVMPVMLPPGRARLATKSCGHWIEGRHEHDRDLACGVPGGQHRRRTRSQENVHAATGQLGRGARHLRGILRQGEFDDEVAALDLPDLTQTSTKAVNERGRWLSDAQEADAPDLARFLRRPSERPRRHRAAEQRHELAPLHSITSSAATSSLSGTVNPSILAVLRLITSSNLVGKTTGKLRGFSPLSIRPT